MNLNAQYTVVSHMIEGFSFDRGNFKLKHNWARTLTTGAVCGGLVFLATYCVIQMMNPMFGTGLDDQVVNFKIASGSLLVALLSYSLFGLFNAIQADTKTALRLQRVESWLREGFAFHARSELTVPLATCKLSMLRCVEHSEGIQVFLLARSDSFEKPFLIQVMLFDASVTATGSIFCDADEVGAHITHVCDIWTPVAARVIGIELDSPDPLTSSNVDDADEVPRYGRASTPVQGKAKASAQEVICAS